MKEWKMAMIMVVILSAAPFIVLCDDTAADNETTVSPNISSIEYDSSESTNLEITTDKYFGLRVCRYNITDSKGVIQLHGSATSSTNFFTIDTAVATLGYLEDGSYNMYFDNRTVPYAFDIVKVTFNGNGTAMKSQSVHLSTDSLSTYAMPAGFIWNTERDGSGAWVSNLSSADFVNYATTLYAFKGSNIGITVSACSSAVIPGSDAVVHVNLDNNAGIAEIDLSIEYDAAAMKLEKVTSGGILKLEKSTVADNPYVAVLTTNENTRTIGNLLTLTFSVSPGASLGQYPVVVKVDASEDMYGKIVPNTVSGCTVTVGERIRGDLSGDNSIDRADAVMIMNRLAEVPTGLDDSEFDLNGDGEVDALDSLIMTKYLAGMPVTFANSSEDDVTMTVSESSGNSSVEGFYEGENVYIAAESGTTVTVSTSSGPVDVRTVSENRYVLTAPGTDFTVKFS